MKYTVLFLLILTLGGCMNKAPESLLDGVSWSFKETAPIKYDDFISKVKKYNKESLGVFSFFSFIKTASLYSDSGLSQLNIIYEYYIETETGEWKDIEKTVELKSSNGTMTGGEILYKIHFAVQENLKDQDGSFFEELTLSDEHENQEISIYDMFLGS